MAIRLNTRPWRGNASYVFVACLVGVLLIGTTFFHHGYKPEEPVGGLHKIKSDLERLHAMVETPDDGMGRVKRMISDGSVDTPQGESVSRTKTGSRNRRPRTYAEYLRSRKLKHKWVRKDVDEGAEHAVPLGKRPQKRIQIPNLGPVGKTVSISHEALQKKIWKVTDAYTSPCQEDADVAIGKTVFDKICQMEMEEILPNKNDKATALLVDTSLHIRGVPTKYYAKRDADNWKITYGDAGFSTRVEYRTKAPSLFGWDVEHCLGLERHDACIRPASVHLLMPHQRLSMIKGFRDILWRKDEFCRTTAEILEGFGPSKFIIPCFVLPQDANAFHKDFHSRPGSNYMVKPMDRGEGHGLYVAHTLEDIEHTKNKYIKDPARIVQPFMENPLLINNRKFDMRTYVLVTSISPLRVYMYNEGLVRFAASNYSANSTRTGAKDQYLTNTSVGKLHALLKDLVWTFEQLWAYMDTTMGVSSRGVLEEIHAAIISVLLMGEARFHKYFRDSLNGDDCGNCFQLLGVDVILDDTLQPKIIEINGLPSQQLTQDQGDKLNMKDSYTLRKLHLAHDIVAIMFKPDSVADVLSAQMDAAGIGLKPGLGCTTQHEYCIDREMLRKLMRMYREERGRGDFERIFPTTKPLDEEIDGLAYYMHNRVQQEAGTDSIVRTSYGLQTIVQHLSGKVSVR